MGKFELDLDVDQQQEQGGVIEQQQQQQQQQGMPPGMQQGLQQGMQQSIQTPTDPDLSIGQEDSPLTPQDQLTKYVENL